MHIKRISNINQNKTETIEKTKTIKRKLKKRKNEDKCRKNPTEKCYLQIIAARYCVTLHNTVIKHKIHHTCTTLYFELEDLSDKLIINNSDRWFY